MKNQIVEVTIKLEVHDVAALRAAAMKVLKTQGVPLEDAKEAVLDNADCALYILDRGPVAGCDVVKSESRTDYEAWEL